MRDARDVLLTHDWHPASALIFFGGEKSDEPEVIDMPNPLRALN
jgi:hypothetical protein